MGRFSLEFGRKGPEGLKAEHDEDLIDDQIQGDGSEIKKLLDDLEASMDEEDYSDCAKTEEKKESEKEDDFSDCLKKSVKEDEEIDEYYDDCDKETLEKAKEEMDRLNKEIKDIFG